MFLLLVQWLPGFVTVIVKLMGNGILRPTKNTLDVDKMDEQDVGIEILASQLPCSVNVP